MNSSKSNNLKIVLIAIVVFGLIFGVVTVTQNWGKSNNTVSEEASLKKLDSLYSRLSINKPMPKLDPDFQMEDEGAARISVLPDISEYPFIVNPTTDQFITIYSSTEKAMWLADIANRFNMSGMTVGGKPVSVGVRAVPSSLGADFISSGKYMPDAYLPASSVYGDMLTSHGVRVNLVEERLAGNISGIVISSKKNDALTKKHGDLTIGTISESVLKGELALGYTTPLSNEDGFSFILSLLSSFDNSDPVSDSSIARLREFQDRVPLIAYDNDQLKAALTGGTLDAIVLSYQGYMSSPNLKSSFVFLPIDTRLDNPVYEIGDLSAAKKEILAGFVSFCKGAEAQQSATDKGFNGMDERGGAVSMNGATILQIQDIYKREKNGSSGITAVFVADVSGSMEGAPMLNLKASLNHAIGVIDSNSNIGLVTFSDGVNIPVPIAKFDSVQKSYFSYAVKAMNATGGTAMYDAVVVAQKMLMDAKAANPNTKLMLFVLTDGEANRGYSFRDIEGITSGLRIPVYTIGYNADIDELQRLSNINEATTMNADSDNVIYRIESLFNAQM